MRVQVLTSKIPDQNTVAFLAPIVYNKKRIRDLGIDVELRYRYTKDLGECDVVAINSKYWSGAWERNRDSALRLLDRLSKTSTRLYYFDRSSTAGSVITDIMPYVDKYYKTSLYTDKSNYYRDIYCNRLFSEYYFTNFMIEDKEPATTFAVDSADDIDKLELSWNTSLANYSVYGPRLGALYLKFPIASLLVPTSNFVPPSTTRPKSISCRMTVSYGYETVAYQRRRLAEILVSRLQADRIPKRAYFAELASSRSVLSPFGFSEINYKDFEVFISGALLIKPNMSHLTTWPDLYDAGRTFVSHSWDLTDLENVIEDIDDNYDQYVEIARAGQLRYRAYVATTEGRQAFAHRFVALMNGETPSSYLPSPLA